MKAKRTWSIEEKVAILKDIKETGSLAMVCQSLNFMSKKDIGKHYLQIDKKLHQWYENVENEQIDEVLNFKTLVESNE